MGRRRDERIRVRGIKRVILEFIRHKEEEFRKLGEIVSASE